MANNKIKIGFLTISDRAARGVYEDISGPAMQDWISKAVTCPYEIETKVIEDEQPLIEKTLIDMSDNLGCNLILTTGGTGPTTRDLTPEATEAVCERIFDGFAEQMRTVSLRTVPTAILSRQIAGTRVILPHTRTNIHKLHTHERMCTCIQNQLTQLHTSIAPMSVHCAQCKNAHCIGIVHGNCADMNIACDMPT